MDSLERDAAGQPIFPIGTIFHFRDIGLLSRPDCRTYWKVNSEADHGQTRVYNVVAVEGEEAGIEAEKEPPKTGIKEKRKRSITPESEPLESIEPIVAGSSTSTKPVPTLTPATPAVDPTEPPASILRTSSLPSPNVDRGRNGRFTKKKKKDTPIVTEASAEPELEALPSSDITDPPRKVMNEDALGQPAPPGPTAAEAHVKPSFVPQVISPTIAREIKVHYKSSKQYQQAPTMHWETDHHSLSHTSAIAGWLEVLLPGENLWTVGVLTGLIMVSNSHIWFIESLGSRTDILSRLCQPVTLDEEDVQGQEADHSARSRKPRNKSVPVGIAAQAKHTKEVITAAISKGAWLRCPVLLPRGGCYIAEEDGKHGRSRRVTAKKIVC